MTKRKKSLDIKKYKAIEKFIQNRKQDSFLERLMFACEILFKVKRGYYE
jgi:hypothetical protein